VRGTKTADTTTRSMRGTAIWTCCRLFSAITWFLLLTTLPAAGQTCPSSSVTLPAPTDVTTQTYQINLLPCQTASFVISAEQDWFGSVISLTGFSSTQQLFSYNVLAGNINTTLPDVPYPGVVGSDGILSYITLQNRNWPLKSHHITITKAPREGWNVGSDSIAAAPQAVPFTEYYGSVSPFEHNGQYFKVTLQPEQAIYLTGHVHKYSGYNTTFRVNLVDSSGTALQTLVAVLATASGGSTPYPASPGSAPVFVNTQSVATDYFLQLQSLNNELDEFSMMVNTPTLTVTPNPVVRGDTASFALRGVDGASISQWSYVTSNPAAGTITRTSGADDQTVWTGQVVAGGTGMVTVTFSGHPYSLQQDLQISSRTWSFPAVSAVKQQTGYVVAPCSATLTANSPELGIGGDGKYLACIRWDLTLNDVGEIPSGPNKGLKWVMDVRDLTTADWVAHPDVDDSASQWYIHQCGTWVPSAQSTCTQPAGTGWISGADYSGGIQRHESALQNGHHGEYVTAQNDPANNIKTGAEGLIGLTSDTPSSFLTYVNSVLTTRQQRIYDAYRVEPCSQTCTATCVDSMGIANTKLTGNWYQATCP